MEGNPRVLAARLHLQVFQVHGKPVPWFAELAGEDGYNRPDYGGDYAPQLRWPVIER